MKRGDFVFVYGTLRRGQGMDMSELGAEFVAEDSIQGVLYDCGWYPGVKLGRHGEGPHIVIGEVFRIRDKTLPDHLDSYEGYPRLYDRSQVTTSGGRLAWVYTYNQSLPETARIMSGDWKTFFSKYGR